jgi:hypothetical protein
MSLAIESLPAYAVWVANGFTIVVILLWLTSRSHSFFDIRYRLWRFSRSGDDIADEAVRRAVRDRADLITFRTLLMRADTIGEMKRLIEFTEENGLEPGCLGDCGRYFHRRTLAIKENLPSLFRAKKLFELCWILLAMITFVLGPLAMSQRALLAFKDDGTRFLLGKDSAKLLQPDAVSFVPDDCSRASQGVAGFSPRHSEALCSAFGGHSLGEIVENGVKSQRILAVGFFITGLLLVACGRRRLHAVRAAYAVKSWLELRAQRDEEQRL